MVSKNKRNRKKGVASHNVEHDNIVSIRELNTSAYEGQNSTSSWGSSIYDGDKFWGGFGETQIQDIDYWTLRQRSSQLFNENLYARGMIRRLVTNEITTGLTPEVFPEEKIIGVPIDSLNEWTDDVESRFSLWAKNPKLCDFREQENFASIQQSARMEALVSGDVLVVLRQSKTTRLPQIQLISGNSVQSPLLTQIKIPEGSTICHGVEKNKNGRVVAYWIVQEDMTYERLPAYGEKTGRRIAWLVFGTDKRLGDVRGQPILSLVLQSLKEIDRYRDAVLRKAVVNSILAMFIKKTQDKMGTLPITNGAIRKDQITNNTSGEARKFNITKNIPGMVMEELQHGEEPVGFSSQGVDMNFGAFEDAIIHSIAWANEIPPEVMKLSFSSNYSASQAAINEFKIYINKVWGSFGGGFCSPIYEDWLISEVLNGKIRADGFLDAWRNPLKHDIFGAWVSAVWYGSIKLSTKAIDQAKASKMYVEQGWSTHTREARITTGTKFDKNVQQLAKENAQLVKALTPIAEFKMKYGEKIANEVLGATGLPNIYAMEVDNVGD